MCHLVFRIIKIHTYIHGNDLGEILEDDVCCVLQPVNELLLRYVTLTMLVHLCPDCQVEVPCEKRKGECQVIWSHQDCVFFVRVEGYALLIFRWKHAVDQSPASPRLHMCVRAHQRATTRE